MTTLENLGAWPARVLWVALALAAGPCVGDALAGRSTAVAVVTSVGLWAGWGVGAMALLVPRSTALTALRIVVPGGVVAVLAAVGAGGSPDGFDVAAVALGALAAVAVLVPWVGEAWVDGSSYGNEQRLPLRPPPVVAFVFAPLTWALVLAGVAVGPLLLAARSWVVGAVALAVGWAAAYVGVRALHQLSRRWVVLVPSGMVLHDTLVMPEPQLFLRHTIASLGPALADAGSSPDTEDLTAGAAGLALHLTLSEPVELLVREGRRGGQTQHATGVLFTPSRPLRTLEAASKRRLPVG